MGKRKIAVLLAIIALAGTVVVAQNRVGRRAGRGAAMGAVWGLILGGDIDDAIEGAAAGAAVGAVGGAIDNSYAKKDRRRYYEQQRAQQQAEAQALARAQAEATEAERQRLENERLELEAEKLRLEEAEAVEIALAGESLTEERWIEVVGVDNWNALVALVDCQHNRARLLAQAAATVEDPEYQLASRWVEALIAVDVKDSATSKRAFAQLVDLDGDIDSVQQASIEADKAVLDVRQIRRDEGITCSR